MPLDLNNCHILEDVVDVLKVVLDDTFHFTFTSPHNMNKAFHIPKIPEELICEIRMECMILEGKFILYMADKLCYEIKLHNHLYYNKAKPMISDFEYDKKYKELEKYEKEISELSKRVQLFLNSIRL